MNYSYDFNEDWVPASKNQLRAFWFFGIINCFSGSVFLINYLRDDPPNAFTLITAIGFLTSGIIAIFLNVRKHKPLVPKGTYFLKIKDGLLRSKLGRFAREKQLSLDQIKKASIDEQVIILQATDGSELYIKSSRIRNKEKKEEFEQIIRSQIPHH